MNEDIATSNVVELATELTIAWLSNPNTRASAEEVPSFLKAMHEAVGALGSDGEVDGAAEPAATHTPAVSVRKSLASKDHIISMIDGKPYKTLRRHLSRHGMTPEQYRERYGLKSDYPMVSETYSTARRDMAKKIGLGRKPGMKRPAGAAPKKPARKAEDA
ncbi:Ros/MucR family transcriptional regulator [Sphingomonas sp. RS2018]